VDEPRAGILGHRQLVVGEVNAVNDERPLAEEPVAAESLDDTGPIPISAVVQ
jgi:hypothetical protein